MSSLCLPSSSSCMCTYSSFIPFCRWKQLHSEPEPCERRAQTRQVPVSLHVCYAHFHTVTHLLHPAPPPGLTLIIFAPFNFVLYISCVHTQGPEQYGQERETSVFSPQPYPCHLYQHYFWPLKQKNCQTAKDLKSFVSSCPKIEKFIPMNLQHCIMLQVL